MGEAAPKDNSMEEILASIRRIISSDDDEPATGGKSAAKDTSTPPEPAPGTQAHDKPAEARDSRLETTSERASAPTTPSPQPAAQAGTLAGLAQQLRGTRGLDAPEEKPQPDRVSVETVPASPAGSGKAAETAAPPKVASAGTAQSLADLAKSINQKIGAAAARENTTPPASPNDTGPEMQPEASSQRADTPAAAAKAETPASGSLADLAESLQSYVDGSEPAPSMVRDDASAGVGASGLMELENELADELEALPQPDGPARGTANSADALFASEAQKAEQVATSPSPAKAAHGADKPEAFREALVSPATRQAVSSSMDRLKQATADLSQAQVETVLRPLLKDWLDDNLPAMVERMVQQEIDRIAAPSGSTAEEDLQQSKSA